MNHSAIVLYSSAACAFSCFTASLVTGHWQYNAFGFAFLAIELMPCEWYDQGAA